MEKMAFRAMGSGMLAVFEMEGDRALQALAQVPGWFEDWEACLSRFRPESELNQLNRQAGSWVPVSPVLWDVLAAARRVEWLSDGLVTPALQGSLEAYGYDRSFELVAMMNANLRMTEVHTDWPERKEMGVDLETRSIYLPVGTRLDLGGIAKGWAADRALDRLVELGPALVDAGGDIALSPRSALDACWPVAVTDPH
ncbi:MAG: FAD:protein FMN transferase, partial [Anaerolineales bacterium]